MGAVGGDVAEEVLGVETLSMHPPVVIGKAHHDRVDFSRLDFGSHRLQAQQAAHFLSSFGASEAREREEGLSIRTLHSGRRRERPRS